MILHDLRCKDCDKTFANVAVESGAYGRCDCGGERTWVPATFTTFEWGGPKFVTGLDREFSSRSEMQDYCKRNGWSQAPSADKHHGARNESHLHRDRIYSIPTARNEA